MKRVDPRSPPGRSPLSVFVNLKKLFTCHAKRARPCAYHGAARIDYAKRVNMLPVFGMSKNKEPLELPNNIVAHALGNLGFRCAPFSSPEAALLLVSTKNRDLWECPTPEVRDSRTSRRSAHCQS